MEEERKKSRLSLSQREALWGYAFISPWIIGFLIFTLGPMLASLYFSFTDYNIIDPPTWAGIDNYRRAFFEDPIFWHSLKRTLYFAALALPLGLAFGLLLAILLNQDIPGVNLWRTLYFLPSVIAGVAIALLWSRIFNPRVGILNPFLENVLGIENPPGWLLDPDWAIPALVIMGLWGIGGTMIIYLAGLQGIPTTLYEVAKIDGANSWQRFRNVTLPLMTPVIFYNLVIGLIASFQYFTEVYVVTSASGELGGPARSTLVYNLYLFQNAFRFFEMGYASALAWILFVIILVVTVLVFRSSPMWVFYEGQVRR
ncbi:MAG: sugar ABC transporter permease [Candidatus Promineifilaceae bacterium]|nr:sugar ABC transporter permease [Candidatus Promineifilaceae bacterium]